jgi:3-deoxy-D-manno-octulosonic-acid transferase
VEAIAAKVPVVFGPDMTNFADLVSLLNAEKSVWQCEKEALKDTLVQILSDKDETAARCERAYNALHVHSGATRRSVELVETLY